MTEETLPRPDNEAAPPRPSTGIGEGRELLRWLRHQRAHHPVWWDEQTGSVQVFTHADVLEAMSKPEVFSSDLRPIMPDRGEGVADLDGVLAGTDPPRHGKLRRLVNQAFNARTVAELEPRIRELAGELLDSVAGTAEFDFGESLSLPLPLIVISEMLGFPREDYQLLKRWANAILRSNAGIEVGALPTEGVADDVAGDLRDVRRYFVDHARDRRRNPGDDLITRLVQAEWEGQRLSDAEIANFLNFMLVAGHLTTTLTMSSAMVVLGQQPGMLEELRRNRELIPSFIEEVFRLYPPTVMAYRLVTETVWLRDREIAAGSPVVCWFLSANRDEARFPDAERAVVQRDDGPHLTFGRGIHYCVGAPLARLENRVVLNELLDRYDEIAVSEVSYFDNLSEVFGPKAMRVRAE